MTPLTDWRTRYAELAGWIEPHAKSAAPLLAGFNTCVDHIYRPTTDALDVLTAAGPDQPELAALLRERIAIGEGGELLEKSGGTERWLANRIGEPVATQVGGTGAQAAWVLAMLGAPAVLALADRSSAQLAVVHPAVRLVTGRTLTSAGRVDPVGEPIKRPHYILEFSAGTDWSGGTIPRSDRLIVRFAEDGIECDSNFAEAAPWLAALGGAGLVSGLNGIPDRDRESRTWLRDVVTSWRDANLPTIHLELGEYVRGLRALVELISEYADLANSVGMNLSELRTLAGPSADPATAALQIAQRYGLTRVLVHADRWSLAVHCGDPARARTAVELGNLLAAARASQGAPTSWPAPDPDATFSTDHPVSRTLEHGWRVECAPTPYLLKPRTTIGLGDAFVAGAMLADCIDRHYHHG